MGRNVSLKDLSKTVLIDQLRLCWKHFRVCLAALEGEKVTPVELLSSDELGDCDDLELFYACKRAGGSSEVTVPRDDERVTLTDEDYGKG